MDPKDFLTARIKHLEFIQAAISRMAGNSMLMKGWGITAVTALIALGAAKDGKPKLMLLALLPLASFFVLDLYYLYLERKFRRLYEFVRLKKVEEDLHFEMNVNSAPESENALAILLRPSIWLFWLGLALSVLLIYFLV